MPLKIDLHVHTRYSSDAITTLRDLILYSKKQGIDGVAITDHNTIEGAIKAEEHSIDRDGLILIPGVEVSTSWGDVVGLNLSTLIPKGLGLAETAKSIHDAGGIAIAAHPFQNFAIYKSFTDILKKETEIDAIEVISPGVFPFFLCTHLARRLALQLNLPQIGSSDSHTPETIGSAYTIVDADPDIDDIIQAIKRGLTTPCLASKKSWRQHTFWKNLDLLL